MPAAALTSDAIVHERLAAPPAPSARAPAPGAPTVIERPAAGAGHGPRRRPAGAARLAEPRFATGRLRAVRLDGRRGHGRRPGPWSGGAARQAARPRRSSRRRTATRRSGRIDPWLGAALSVAEATRNVAITGARPLGVTNCLNYGDPTRPEAFWQLSEGVRGLGDACRALGLPVTGGNVSLYNESPGGSIAPTPEIGVVGLLDDVGRARRPGLRRRGRLDRARRARRVRALRGSEYARARRRRGRGRPAVARPRPARRRSRHSSARRSRAGWSHRRRTCRVVGSPSRSPSARSGAGSARASGCRSPTRRPSSCSARARRGSSLTTRPRHAPALELLARQHGLPVETIGTVGGDRARRSSWPAPAPRAPPRSAAATSPTSSTSRVDDLRHAWDHGLERALGWEG